MRGVELNATDPLIEPMGLGDAGAVADLVKSTFESRLWPYMSYTQSGSAAFLAVPIAHPSAFPDLRSFVVREGGAVAAFASFQLSRPHGAFLSYICVAPSSRGRGLATKLIDHFLQRERGVRELRLDVFADNTAALALYAKLGFARESRSVWAAREMPAAGAARPVNRLAATLAAHAAYGFGEISIGAPAEERTYSVLGTDVVRCRDRESFDDDTALSTIRSVFDASTAFAVIGEDELGGIVSEYETILWSERMVLHVSNQEDAG